MIRFPHERFLMNKAAPFSNHDTPEMNLIKRLECGCCRRIIEIEKFAGCRYRAGA
jgi:hypothetical protein